MKTNIAFVCAHALTREPRSVPRLMAAASCLQKKTLRRVDLQGSQVQAAVSFCQANQQHSASPEWPAQQTVNIIGILTRSRCGQVCKIVNKEHDGATACPPGGWKGLVSLAIIQITG